MKISQTQTTPKPVISVKNVSKTFVIPHEKISTLRSMFVSLFRKNTKERFKALSNISFDVQRGEFIGIIGRNGSGKSTLLKILAGVYVADQGVVEVREKISPFLELGIGFNPELSGRDNVYLNATVLGLTEKEIDKKYDSIVAFSELSRFMDQKIKNYSSGMQVRLAFSVAIHANRDVLLMDEVLAVGDMNFQAKCIREFHRYRQEGKTVVLVTHDTGVVEQYCDRAILLRSGNVEKIGSPEEVAALYRTQNMKDAEVSISGSQTEKAEAGEGEWGSIDKVVFIRPGFGEKRIFTTGDDLTLRVFFTLDKKIRNLPINPSVAIFNQEGNYIFGINTIVDKVESSSYKDRGFFEIQYKQLPLRNGRYYLKIGIFGESYASIYAYLGRSPEFEVFSLDESGGYVNIEHLWS